MSESQTIAKLFLVEQISVKTGYCLLGNVRIFIQLKNYLS